MKSKLTLALLLALGCASASLAATKPTVERNVKATKSASLPRVLDLGADKCIPCKMMQPILADLRKEYAGRVRVDFIDIWKNPEEAERYQVRSIPTQIFFTREGKEVYRHVGFFPKESIVGKLKEMGIK